MGQPINVEKWFLRPKGPQFDSLNQQENVWGGGLYVQYFNFKWLEVTEVP